MRILLPEAKNSLAPIGIFGGAFDPIHFGHLRAALEIAEKFLLAKVYFVPCQTPVHKAPTVAAAPHRMAMLNLAVKKEVGFCVDDREIQRETPSYMVETLHSFREEFGRERSLALILGADALLGLTAWREWEKIFDLAHIIVVSRETQKLRLSPELRAVLNFRKNKNPQTIFNSVAGDVFFQRVTRLDISSSLIRTKLAKQQSPHYLVPEVVLEYIQQEGLYV